MRKTGKKTVLYKIDTDRNDTSGPKYGRKLPNLSNIDRVIISVPALLQKNHRLVWNRTGKQWTIFQNYHIQRRNDSESSCSKRSGTSTRIILHIFLNSRDKRPQVTKI